MLRFNMFKLIFAVTIGMVSLVACSSTEQQEDVQLTVSVAASMSDAIEEIALSFEQDNPNINILLNVGSSGGLQQQITQGAPADLFLSAAEDKMNVLLDQGLVDEEYVTPLLGNKLVLIVSKHEDAPITSFNDLAEDFIDKIAIGTPESVPAGMYAKQTLITRNLFDQLENKLVYGKDVRQVLTYVETESVQAGVVYLTDAMKSDVVNVVDRTVDQDHMPIIYPAGIVKSTENRQQAILFYEFLNSDLAFGIFEKYGFSPLEVDQ